MGWFPVTKVQSIIIIVRLPLGGIFSQATALLLFLIAATPFLLSHSVPEVVPLILHVVYLFRYIL